MLDLSFKSLALATWLALLAASAMSAPLKVDLSQPGRNDTGDPNYIEWPVQGGDSISRTFDGVTVTFSKGDGGVRGDWFRAGLDFPALMATDGLVGEGGGPVEMKIEGLSPGKHTISTFHNTFNNPERSQFGGLNVSLNGRQVVSGLKVPNRVLDNYDAVVASVEVDVSSGQPVTLAFESDGTGTNHNVHINGFEIGTVDPAKRAAKPFPHDGDLHADADDGDLHLMWRSGAGAVSHDIYIGHDAAAVANAGPDSPEFKGNRRGETYEVAEASNLKHYYWRVDEVDAEGHRHKGEVWLFSPRHLAFPTAEGYGRFARGGRGGVVYAVTNLNDSGPGSFRYGLEQVEGPRTIVFNVSGVIKLSRSLSMRDPFITVAGQTAPGMGICLRTYNFGMQGNRDGILRFIRVRPGNEGGRNLDGIGLGGANHSIVDHCTVSWTLDEAVASRGAKNITVQRCIIAEALNVAGHANYPPGTRHGYAGSIGGDVGSFHHNLLAHNEGRNWSMAGGLNKANRHTGKLDLRNNVVYNWRSRTTDGGAEEVNFVGNYYKPGPATRLLTELNPQFENPGFGPQRYYVEGNVMEGVHGPEGPQPPFEGVNARPQTPWGEFIVAEPFFEPYVETHTAAEAYKSVLADVGCNRPASDPIDLRIIEETRNGTFTYRGSQTNDPGLPDNEKDVGGWPDYPQETRPANWDTDGDGLPNHWEEARDHLDPNDPKNGNEDYNGDGYTNLEDYLNTLAGDIET